MTYQYLIDYASAVKWCHNSYVMMNNVTELNEDIIFELPNLETEIFQWFVSDCSDFDVKFLREHFPDLIFVHSDKLNCWILAVDHWGTSWDYVWTTCVDPEGYMLPDKWNNGDGERQFTTTTKAKFRRYKK